MIVVATVICSVARANHFRGECYHQYILADTNKNNDSIYFKVDTFPQFPGGLNAYNKFINKNAHYPKIASDNNIMGEVLFQVLIEKDGSISDIRLIREPGSGMGEEAKRVVKMLPKWVPGIKDGKPVRTWLSIPVNFLWIDQYTTLVTGTKPATKH